ncbi:hypothetical protein [Dokdonia sp.]|uniref:hypothetical protein n=1 Tax=Dokdonia sp. TaxID=2024995 RepID=UPI0032646A3B
MGQTFMLKKNLRETPVISDISSTQTTGASSNENKFSIGTVHISSTKEVQGNTVVNAVKKEYHDTNIPK